MDFTSEEILSLSRETPLTTQESETPEAEGM